MIKNSISFCIVAKNEEKYISNCLRSIKEVADEILLLDTGSTDNTIKLAEIEGAIIIKDNWKSDFALARNNLLSKATSEWVFMIDCDEELSNTSKNILKEFLSELPRTNVYSTKIVNLLEKNKSSTAITHYVPRIIPNNGKFKFIRPIHETLVENDNEIPNFINLKDIEIIHYGYIKEHINKKNKIERNRTILEKALKDNPESLLDYYYLSINYREEGNNEKYLDCIEKVIELYTKNDERNYESIFEMSSVLYLDALINLDKIEEAEEKALKLEKYLSNRGDYWFLFAEIEFRLKKYEKAAKFAEKTLELKNEDIIISQDLGLTNWKPLIILTKSYLNLNELEKAKYYYNLALKDIPVSLRMTTDFIDLHLKMKLNQK